jgi:hypothetical protein
MTIGISEKGEERTGPSVGDDGSKRLSYEAPTLTLVGNARDLLAGGSGTIQDVQPLPGTQVGG